ncbi:MAG: TetR/AcrR family transcriptional regulator [Candidatus Brocadiales bacterium]|nr:TetR/AcrR family transcriptional regulator [Candidatus Brocadiales bacterium]
MPIKKRARSDEDKDVQFRRILVSGLELLQENNGKGFSMRKLAKRLNMAPSNLYNYVKNENELKIMILNEHLGMSIDDYEIYFEAQKKPYIEILSEIITHFFESNTGEYNWAFVELVNIQHSKEKGLLDLDLLINPYKILIEKAIENEELPPQNPELSALYVWSTLLGVVNTLHLASSKGASDITMPNMFLKYAKQRIISSLKSEN